MDSTDDLPVSIRPFKRIRDNRQCEKVPYQDSDGKRRTVLIDGTTAALVMQVWEKLNPENRAKLATMPPNKIGILCWKLTRT